MWAKEVKAREGCNTFFVWTSNNTKMNFATKFGKTTTLEHKINVDQNHQEKHAKQLRNANHGVQTPRAEMQRGVVGATWVRAK